MRHLRMLGLMLLGAMAFGSYAAATASAEEPGILPLLGAKSVEVKVTTGEGKEPKLRTAAGEIRCTSLAPTTASATGSHITLFNEVVLTFLECGETKGESKLSCRSENLKGEKDPAGTVLVLADLHLVDLLSGTSLVPGGAVIILDQNTKEQGVSKVKCGIGNVEAKGISKGTGAVASLTTDIKSGTVNLASTSIKCDTSDTLCMKYETKELECLINLSGTFEPATLEVTLTLTSNVEVLFDD